MEDDLWLAHLLADLADEVTSGRFESQGFTVRRKADGSEVTDADIEVEEALLHAVRTHRPGDGFLGEELGVQEPEATSRTWVVDGIDGTSAFAAGGSMWGTLIALEEGAEIVVGVASSPGLGARWWASHGGGAWTSGLGVTGRRNAGQLTVSRRSSLEHARVSVLPKPGRLDGWRAASGRHVVDVLGPCDPGGHGALLVADGAIDASIHLWGGPWDHASFVVLVEEAGGRFSDLWGGRRLGTGTAVFSNGRLHDDICKLARTKAPVVPETI
jgi:histidinol-phosphatase